MLRRTVVFVIFVSGITGWTARSASAAPAPVAEMYTESIYRVEQRPGEPENGIARTLVEHRVVDRNGRVLSKETFRTENAGRFRASEATPFACSHQGYRAGLSRVR